MKNIVVYNIKREVFGDVWESLRELGFDGGASRFHLDMYVAAEWWCVRVDFDRKCITFLQRKTQTSLDAAIKEFTKLGYTIDKFVDCFDLVGEDS